MTSNEKETGRPCLLVVDDDATIREMLSVALGGSYKVVCLPGGEGVLGAIELHRPSLLVLDVNMPGGDGYGVCERVREEARHRRLPILFITARTDDATFLKTLASGGNALVVKPFEVPAFRERVRLLLEGAARS